VAVTESAADPTSEGHAGTGRRPGVAVTAVLAVAAGTGVLLVARRTVAYPTASRARRPGYCRALSKTWASSA
jgi:hypothetical protein